MIVADDVLADPDGYRRQVLAGRFEDIAVGPAVFRGIQLMDDPTVPQWITTHYPQLTPIFTFCRQSPAGQPEPNYVHTDRDMGDWTAIVYLNDAPAAGDGTTFWRHRVSGALASRPDAWLDEPAVWHDLAQWEPVATVGAKLGRLVLFPAARFHSRAIRENYGTGETARLIQVVFGTGDLGGD